jgi:diguanylate cyclase (GGDEF)-like protein
MGIRIWAIAGLLVSLLAASLLGAFTGIDNGIEARRFALARAPVASNILVVAIDSNSIAQIGQWPWPRSVHAQIVDRLAAAKASQIALDIDFSSPSPVPGDDELQRALEAAGGATLLAGFKQSDAGQMADTVPLAKFAAHGWVASVSVRADADGIVRSVPYSEMLAGEETPSLAAYFAQASQAGTGDIRVDYAIASSSFPVVSAIDVIEGRVPAGFIAGKDVIVAATAVELRDIFVIPTGEIVPGGILQALAAETARLARSVVKPGPWLPVLGLAALGLLALLMNRRSWRAQLRFYTVAFLSLEVSAFVLLWAQQISLPTASWLAAMAGLAIVSTACELDFRKLRIGSIQTRLGATKALLQEVISDSPAGVIVVDDSDRIRVANAAACRILKADQRNWTGLLAADVLPPALTELFEAARDPLSSALAAPRLGQVSLQLARATMVLEYSLTKSALANDGDGAALASARCLTFHDVTERQHYMERLSYLALHDAKTGSKNRNSFFQDLQSAAAAGQRCTVLHMGLDRFKTVNEEFGHEAGDQLLGVLAARAKAIVGDGRELYRVGGDEFACILSREQDVRAAGSLAQSLLVLIGPVRLGLYEAPLNMSIGIAAAPEGEWSADEITRRSGLALAFAKSGGGNRICIFDSSLDEAGARRKAIESALVGALARDEFLLNYQPQFDLASGRCVGIEALLRWTAPALGNVSPAEFIPIAEQIGLIDELGDWVIRQSCRDIAAISRDVVLAVNVSPRQLLRGNIAATIAGALTASGLPPNRLEVEVTETVLAENRPRVAATLETLRKTGISVALDDFGTGYSSLSYLLNLPIDKLKIDKSFVASLPQDAKAAAVLSSILGVAKTLGFTSLAEGVETAGQLAALKEAGCEQGQGFLLAKPMAAGALAVFLQILGLGREAPVPRDPQSARIPA